MLATEPCPSEHQFSDSCAENLGMPTKAFRFCFWNPSFLFFPMAIIHPRLSGSKYHQRQPALRTAEISCTTRQSRQSKLYFNNIYEERLVPRWTESPLAWKAFCLFSNYSWELNFRHNKKSRTAEWQDEKGAFGWRACEISARMKPCRCSISRTVSDIRQTRNFVNEMVTV